MNAYQINARITFVESTKSAELTDLQYQAVLALMAAYYETIGELGRGAGKTYAIDFFREAVGE